MNALECKEKKLKEYLNSLGTVAVAFSSGVDSTLLLKEAHELLGDKVMAITIKSPAIQNREITDAIKFCQKENIKHYLLNVDDLNQIVGFKENKKDRCYICKKFIFSQIKEIAKENGFDYVVDGSNVDDQGDYRPGLKALKELEIKSPLNEAGLTKKEIRELSKKLDLETWDKPSCACLASRIPYGEEITSLKLQKIDLAEDFLKDLGFVQLRVRVHGDIARIEIEPNQFEMILDENTRKTIDRKFKEIGFSYVTVDLAGYQMGSMNKGV